MIGGFPYCHDEQCQVILLNCLEAGEIPMKIQTISPSISHLVSVRWFNTIIGLPVFSKTFLMYWLFGHELLEFLHVLIN